MVPFEEPATVSVADPVEAGPTAAFGGHVTLCLVGLVVVEPKAVANERCPVTTDRYQSVICKHKKKPRTYGPGQSASHTVLERPRVGW